MDSKFLSKFLGTLYKRHGMSVSYKDGYVDGQTPCNFICSVHGDFVNKPHNVVHQGISRNGCGVCASKNRMKSHRKSLVCGVGINDWDDVVYVTANDKIPEYKMWKDMLKRVYSPVYQAKSKHYIGASCDPKWLSLKGFIEDVSRMPNYDKGLTGGWSLDKDIIVTGNKHYSKDTCAFVPQEINSNFKTSTKSGGLPMGVYSHKNGKFACDCSIKHKTHYLGMYDTPEEAFAVRKTFKQKHMKNIAAEYEGVVDSRVILKLKGYDYDYNGNIY